MLTDTPLEDQVIATLAADPRLPAASEIAVSSDGGIVMLRGTVESFGQRRAAVQDARGIDGVYEVLDQLKVNLLGEDRREDDEIRGAALQTLMWDADLPADGVDVKVSDGWVTLKGDLMHQYQSDAAFDDVATLYGVVGVTNEIRVTTL